MSSDTCGGTNCPLPLLVRCHLGAIFETLSFIFPSHAPLAGAACAVHIDFSGNCEFIFYDQNILIIIISKAFCVEHRKVSHISNDNEKKYVQNPTGVIRRQC